AFQVTEERFSVGDEDVGDAAALRRLDRRVGVVEGHAELRRKHLADRRLAGTRRTDEDHAGAGAAGHHVRSPSGMAARYAAWLRAVSATESPPNFSRHASASTRATIASATTPAAGTAHT